MPCRERSALEGDSVVGSSNSPSDYDGFDVSREIPHQLRDPPPVRFVHKHERATPLHLIVERPEATKYLAEKGADLHAAEYAYNAVRASSFNGNRLHSRSAAAKYLYLLGGFVVEPVVSAALSEAVKAVVDKLKEGKRLKIEDFLLLYLGTIAEELRTMRAEAAERDKSIRGEMAQMRAEMAEREKAIREKMARLRAEIGEMGKRIDETNKRIDEMNKRIDETNKRIDDLYKLLSNIYQVLLDISRQLSAK